MTVDLKQVALTGYGVWPLPLLFIGYKPFVRYYYMNFVLCGCYKASSRCRLERQNYRCKDRECFLEKHLFCRVFASAALFLFLWVSYHKLYFVRSERKEKPLHNAEVILYKINSLAQGFSNSGQGVKTYTIPPLLDSGDVVAKDAAFLA